MALFESYERRIDQINAVLNSYGISSIDNDRNPITCLIDQDKFEKMTSVERQRYIFRLAEAYKCVKQLYREMNADNKVYG